MIKVSIITATYNSEKYLEETYRSIKKQSHLCWEWVITDDCSTDNTENILKEIASKDKRVKVYRNEKNSGAAVARNNSLRNASGKYIAFIDSDDVWKEEKLETQLRFMEAKDLSFSFTAYELINELGRPMDITVDTHLKDSLSYEDMLRKRATLGCSTVMLKRAAYGTVQMPLLRTGQDYATWLSLIKTGQNAYPLAKVLTRYRITPNSISRNKVKKASRQWQIYREVEGLSLQKSFLCFCYYVWRAVFRK